ncbi:hypothetical protein PWT90_04011 [Aphanocladium album]|nr:hypothetical protein PWT90_04011 [Aphanocladium album]
MAWTASEDTMNKDNAPLLDRPRRLSSAGLRIFSRTKRLILGVAILLALFFAIPTSKIRSWPNSDDKVDLEGASEYRNEQSHIAKMCIVYGANTPYYERALATHKLHNRLHGYAMFIQREKILDGYWTKPAHILSVLLAEMSKPKSQRLRWLWWFDADTIILNYKMPLETFLPAGGDDDDEDDEENRIDIVTNDDHNGLNNGVFAVRVSPLSVELFSAVLSFRDMRPNTSLTFADQSALEYMLKERKFAAHAATVPQRWFNAYPIVTEPDDVLDASQVHPGDLAVHFAGMYAEREQVMTEWCGRSERRSPVWNVPVADTGYAAEARRFYEHLRERRRRTRQTWRDQSVKLLALVRGAEKTLAGAAAAAAGASGLHVEALRAACLAANSLLGREGKDYEASGSVREEEEEEEETLEDRPDVVPADVDRLTIVMSNLERAATLLSEGPSETGTEEALEA